MKFSIPFLLILGLASPAMAFSHAETGLEIDLAEPFQIMEAPEASGPGQFVFGVIRSGADNEPLTGGLCSVIVQPGPSSKGDQMAINDMNQRPSALVAQRSSHSSYLGVETVETFMQGDVVGLHILGRSTKEPKGVWVSVSSFETPAALTLLTCNALPSEWPDALELFRTIRQSVTPPA